MFFCGFFAVKNSEKADALTSTAFSNAIKIENGDGAWDVNDDLWNVSKGRINGAVYAEFKKKLFGTTDPKQYITDHADATEITLSDSTVVPASTINGSNKYGYIVKLGGLDWMVASMTLTDNGIADHPVVTLYLANPNGASKYLNSTATTTKGLNMYGSSMLRNTLLNSSVYSLFKSTSTFAQTYLVKPENIHYQRHETMNGRDIDASVASNWNYNLQNDALGNKTTGWATAIGTNYYVRAFTFDGSKYGGTNDRYDAWGNDYIWIPSMTEVGTENTITSGSVWKLSTEQRIHDTTTYTHSWFRSGAVGNFNRVVRLDGSNGERASNDEHYNSNGIRPAIHLDLAAIESAMSLAVPQNAVYTYNGENRDLKAETWYKTNIFDNSTLCTVAYTDEHEVNVTPKDVGVYTATFTLGTDYIWDTGDATVKKRTATLTIKPKELQINFAIDQTTGLPTCSLLDQPLKADKVEYVFRYFDKDTEEDLGTDATKLKGNTQYKVGVEFDNKNYVPATSNKLSFINPATPINLSWDDDGSHEYTGDDIAFYLKDYDTDIIEVSYDGDADFDGYNEFVAQDAGTYTVNVRIKDEYKQDYCWGTGMGAAAGTSNPTTIEYKITPAKRELQVVSIDPEWTVPLGGTCSVELDLQPVFKGTVKVLIWAKRTQNSNPIELCTVDLTEQQHSVQCQFVTTGIRTKGNYIVGAQVYDSDSLAAKNYTVSFDDNYTLTVEEAVQTGGILWRLYAGKNIAGSMTDDSGETSTTWDKTITYDGKAYSFTVNPTGLGLTVDTFYGTKGYKTVKKDAPTKSLSTVTDAGDYVTTVKLSNGAEYSIEWTIEKAKFDLSDLRWIENGNLSYVAGGREVVLDASSIPTGLTPVYGGTRSAVNAGDSGRAEVTFTVDNSDNYEIPDKNIAGSYIFNANGGLTDFEWEKNWTVSAMKIPVNWTVGTLTLDSGKKINTEVLAGGFDEYIKYLYYETDASGQKLDPTATGLDEPEMTDNVIRYYIAEAQINPNFADNCVFASSTNLVSPVFEVGRVLTAVQVTSKKTEYIYWGSPVTFLYNVQGAISSSAFDVSYYKGLTKLNGAPTDPGQYRAQLSLKSAYTTSYYLDGTAAFDFTIVHASVNVSWNESVKPPVLNLTQDQSKYVSYEYRDSAGNTVNFASLSTPGIYDVIAKITDTSRYQFTGEAAANETFTEWFEFEVKAGDTVTDPSSSLPAFTPSTDPNGSGEGGGTTAGKTQIQVWLKNTTVQAGEDVQVGNTYNWDNNAFIITYSLNGQPVFDCNAAGNYQVLIELNPAYSNMFELTGMTSYSFTVVGASTPGDTTITPGGDDDGAKDDGTTGNDPSDATVISYLPIILSGVSLVLIVVFLIMTLNNLSAAKEAKEKTKKLATMSYSFAPTGLLAIVLGLAESNWWIIAGVLMALALVMAIVAFMSKGKKRKALAALEEEQARVAEEKEFARREEMRMMFSSMQQGYQQQQQPFNYDAIQGMIASSMQAFLPAMQQMMALPPAQSDPNAYAQPAYGAPNPEAEALRAQVAAQQAQMAEQQAQMAKQQELLTQILQNQQAQQAAAAEYEEEPVDDISWLGVSDEVISLEESYGALSEDGRRCYYEIGSYIMNKPRTSQNDGRYAVLFKYRGRTIFKLCIKDDAPVLYYPTESGGRGEVRIADAASLEFAKSVVDRTASRVDNGF